MAADSGHCPRQPLILQNRSGNRTSSFSSMFRVSPAGSRMPSGVVTAATKVCPWRSGQRRRSGCVCRRSAREYLEKDTSFRAIGFQLTAGEGPITIFLDCFWRRLRIGNIRTSDNHGRNDQNKFMHVSDSLTQYTTITEWTLRLCEPAAIYPSTAIILSASQHNVTVRPKFGPI